MLFLVGTGISEEGMTIDGIEACKVSDDVYIDAYTSTISASKIEKIESLINKKTKKLSRSDMEENMGRLLSKDKSISILVGGDPLIATTHKIIYTKASTIGIPIKIIHSSSIISAIMGESGLDFYRFGQIVTIARWSEHYKPISFYDTIKRNLENNLHTILLLDYDQKEASSIPINEAITYMEHAEKDRNNGIIKDSTEVIIIEQLSQIDERKIFTNIKNARRMDKIKGMRTMIFPSKITDIEKEIINIVYS